MKKIVSLVLCCLLISVNFGCQNNQNEKIRIGVIAPLTGYASLPGEMCMKGINLVNQDTTKAKNRQYEFVVEDCKSSAKDAISAFRRLYSQGIKYYIVCGGQFAMSVAPLTRDKDVIMFATATANLDLLQTTNRCFRMFPHPQSVVNILSDYATKELKMNKVAIVNIQNDAYALYATLYEDIICQSKGTVVFKEGYSISQKDFKDIITKIIDSNPDYLYLAGMGESAMLFSKQLFANPQSSHIPILGDMNFSLPNTKKIITNFPSPIYYADAVVDETFKAYYYATYQELPNAYSFYSYIIPYIIDEAINNTEKGNIINQIEYIKQHEFYIASDRPIQFDNFGEVNLQLDIYKIQ